MSKDTVIASVIDGGRLKEEVGDKMTPDLAALFDDYDQLVTTLDRLIGDDLFGF